MSDNLGYYTIGVSDMPRARQFFGGLFGWQFETEDEEAPYAHISGSEPAGGIHLNPEQRGAKVWFRVEDIAASVARVNDLGGTAGEPVESDSGWSADCRDDQGTPFSLWQPADGY